MRRFSSFPLLLTLFVVQGCECTQPPANLNGSGGGGTSGGGTATGGGSTGGGGGVGGGGGSLGGGTGGTGGSSGDGGTGGGGGGSGDAGTSCGATQYLANGACVALTVCSATQYETTPASATSDRACTALTDCQSTQFQSTPPTATADRVCSALTACGAGQFEANPPTATSDRICRVISTCTATEYEYAPPTVTTNRVCLPVTVCVAGYEYETLSPTATSDRQCTPLISCGSDEYETVPPTATTDRTCGPLTLCSSVQCETVPPTATTDRVCGPLTLDVTPSTLQTLVVPIGQMTPTVVFTATACGAPVSAAWTLDVGSIGGITGGPSSTSTFRPSGRLGGMVNVIAGYQGRTASRRVLVQLTGSQNGINPASPAEVLQVPLTIAALTAGGGVGGVGGEGLGPALASGDPNRVALQSTPLDGTAQGLKLIYPYDATLWPRGMLAPLLQWDWSFGDADAVRIDLVTTTGSFNWTGTFGRPAILAQLPVARQKFIRHPIPQDIWALATDTAGGPTPTGAPDRLMLTVTVARAGLAYGPITQTWTVAPARLSGTIYYQSYGTNLANNYSGALGTPTSFGAAVLSIRSGDPGPALVSNQTNCQVCHSVAARGARLVTQAFTNGSNDSWQYTLSPSGTTNSQLSRGVPNPGYPALYPDGTMMLTRAGRLQSLPNNAGADLVSTGLSTVTSNLGVPAFSPDGRKIVFNPQANVTNNGRELMVMNFDRLTGAFSSPTVVINDALTTPANPDIRPVWPQFFPDSNSIVFQHQLRVSSDGNGTTGDAHTRKFAQGQLYWTSAIASSVQQPLNALNGLRANGTSYLPSLATGVALSCTADGLAVGSNAGANGDITHSLDPNYNYEPTVNPVSSGGYAWVVFTSRRMYGSVANIPPFCSDPRGVDLHANMTTNTNITPKKLWVAAIDLNAAPGADSSHPAFYLPAQELLAGNARGFWVLDPCRSDDTSCETGDQCCNGFCQPNGVDGALICSNRPPDYVCSGIQELCTSVSDCCDPTAVCINSFCALNP